MRKKEEIIFVLYCLIVLQLEVTEKMMLNLHKILNIK